MHYTFDMWMAGVSGPWHSSDKQVARPIIRQLIHNATKPHSKDSRTLINP
jgi:hypothetical protein